MASDDSAVNERSGGPESTGPPARRELSLPAQGELDRLRDVPIEISVQLDQKRVKVAEVLGFQMDSVIELTRSAGENVDLLLDGAIVGNGEIVVIEDAMGLRITDLRFPERKKGAE